MSLPAPPRSVSVPPSPNTESSPAAPDSVSSPPRPLIQSAPRVPVITSIAPVPSRESKLSGTSTTRVVEELAVEPSLSVAVAVTVKL